jgi:hypothetical protein
MNLARLLTDYVGKKHLWIVWNKIS